MALWRNIGRLASNPAAQGVVDPGPVDVITPLQAVQIVDDATRATKPLIVSEGFVQNNDTIPAGGRHSALEIIPGPGGLFLWLINAPTSVEMWHSQTQAVVSRNPVTRIQLTLPGLSVFNRVALDAAARPADRVQWLIAVAPPTGLGFPGLYLPPNQKWYIANLVAAQAFTATIFFREIPS